MKEITLKVTIEVEDDYILEEENWLLEDAVYRNKYEYFVSSLENTKN